MPKIQLTANEVIQWMIRGIDNGNAEAAKHLGEDFLKAVKEKEDQQNEQR